MGLAEIVGTPGRVVGPGDEEPRRLHASRAFRSGWQARAASVPATGFTGDFYLTCELDDTVWFAVGDFSGHGLGAAIFSMMVREELERSIDHCRNRCLIEIVARLDAILRDELPSNRFASLVVGRAEPDGRVSPVNAGHCHPLVLRRGGAVETIGTGGRVVGIVPAPSWTSASFEMASGDRLLIYTDGLMEAVDDDETEFGTQRIADVASGSGADATVEALLREVEQFRRGRRDDDLSVFTLSR